MWYPEHFLLKHVQSLTKHIDEKSIESYRLNYINIMVQNVSKDTNQLCFQVYIQLKEKHFYSVIT